MRFEASVRSVISIDNELLGQIESFDTDAVTKQPIAWNFRPADGVVLTDDDLHTIADKLDELNGAE